MTDNNLNRRKMLKSIGGTAAATSLLSTASVAIAAEEGVNGELTKVDPVEILEGDEKSALVNKTLKTPEFELLLEKANSEEYSFNPNLNEIYAGRTNAGSFQREVVSYNLTGGDDNERASITIGWLPTDERIIFAYFDIERLDDRDIPETVIRFQLSDLNHSTNDDSMDSNKTIEISKEILNSDPEVKEGFIAARNKQGAVSAQAFGLPDIPDIPVVDFDITTCSGCYYASTLVCRNLCGASGGFLCGLLGITVVGGLSCVTFVGLVCWVAGKAPQCADPVAATVCKDSGLGVCPDSEPGLPISVDIPGKYLP